MSQFGSKKPVVKLKNFKRYPRETNKETTSIELAMEPKSRKQYEFLQFVQKAKSHSKGEIAAVRDWLIKASGTF
ncbi:MAG: hypothetical protein QXQ53_04670 [Candidatus Methanosuratincola sp.]